MLASANADVLAKLARVSGVTLADTPLSGNGVKSTANFDVQVIYERVIDKLPPSASDLPRTSRSTSKGLQAAEKQLGNEAFMGKAPVHIVEGLKEAGGGDEAAL